MTAVIGGLGRCPNCGSQVRVSGDGLTVNHFTPWTPKVICDGSRRTPTGRQRGLEPRPCDCEPGRGKAYISDDGLYRYSLTRDIQHSCNGTCTFVMLNPSTADAAKDDPTIRRCIRFAREWGYSRLKVVNLYAYRATKPANLWLAEDPVGPENDHTISLVFGGSDFIVAAWGANARDDRLESFWDTFGGWEIHALGLTKDCAPRHPLYMPADTEPFVLNTPRRTPTGDGSPAHREVSP